MTRHTICGLLLVCSLALSACGEPDRSGAEASSPKTGTSETAAPTTVVATATQQDVVAALRCHAVLSSAMANRIVVGGDGAAMAGIREQTRWLAEAHRRAEAAGLDDSAFDTLMAETRAPMNTEAQRAENTPVLESCLANVPAL